MTQADQGVERFGAALAAIDAELDWDRVASVYCKGDADGFFDEERRGAVLDAGLKLASDIGEHLTRGGRSLYVGAAVAELAPMLFETLVLGRTVVWVTLKSPETTELTRTLEIVEASIGKSLPKPRIDRWKGRALRPCNHIWMTSVLTDPDAFPALHNELYERRGTKEAVGGGHPKAERQRGRELVEQALASAAPDTRLTTTDEELVYWIPAVEALDGTVDVARTGRTSGLVGDIVRHCRIRLPHGSTQRPPRRTE